METHTNTAYTTLNYGFILVCLLPNLYIFIQLFFYYFYYYFAAHPYTYSPLLFLCCYLLLLKHKPRQNMFILLGLFAQKLMPNAIIIFEGPPNILTKVSPFHHWTNGAMEEWRNGAKSSTRKKMYPYVYIHVIKYHNNNNI